jgi:hypothetical protein
MCSGQIYASRRHESERDLSQVSVLSGAPDLGIAKMALNDEPE